MNYWSVRSGYTIVEVIIALLVFTTAALGLAAGSAAVVREMHMSGVRAEAGRLVASRMEIAQSTCPAAQSGTDRRGSIRSEWTVAAVDSIAVRLAGTVSWLTPRGRQSELYSATVACR
jgi:Tfp pilus assembly protein PilV